MYRFPTVRSSVDVIRRWDEVFAEHRPVVLPVGVAEVRIGGPCDARLGDIAPPAGAPATIHGRATMLGAAPHGHGASAPGPVLLVAAGSLPVLSATMLAVALPDVARTMHIPPAAVSSVVATFFAVQLVVQPFVGTLIARFGIRRSLCAGLALLATGSLAATAAPTLAALLAARAVQALGVAVVLPTVHIQLTSRGGRDGRRFGLLTAVGNLAATGGPPLGCLLVLLVGWRGVFGTTAAIAGLAVIGIARSSHRAAEGAASGTSGVEVARRPQRILSDRRVAVALTMGVLESVVLATLLVGLPFAVGGQGTLAPATAVTTLMVAGTVAAPFGGRLADRVGYAAAARAGFLVAAVGLLSVAAAPHVPGTSGEVAGLAVAGAGLGLGFPAIQAAPLSYVAGCHRARAGCLAAAGRHLGGLIGALLASGIMLLHTEAVVLAAGVAAGVGACLAGELDRRSRRPEFGPPLRGATALATRGHIDRLR